MVLVRLRKNNEHEIILEGDEKDIIHRIHELNLCDYHDVYFYERGKFGNLGLDGGEYDYYTIYNAPIQEKLFTLEERYQLYILRYVGTDEQKNDGSGETKCGKRTMKSFLSRKSVNANGGLGYADRWLDELKIPRSYIENSINGTIKTKTNESNNII